MFKLCNVSIIGQKYGTINTANNGLGENLNAFGVRVDCQVIRMKSLYEVESMERIEAQQQITPDIIENIGINL